jgi:hypothetical protein
MRNRILLLLTIPIWLCSACGVEPEDATERSGQSVASSGVLPASGESQQLGIGYYKLSDAEALIYSGTGKLLGRVRSSSAAARSSTVRIDVSGSEPVTVSYAIQRADDGTVAIDGRIDDAAVRVVVDAAGKVLSGEGKAHIQNPLLAAFAKDLYRAELQQGKNSCRLLCYLIGASLAMGNVPLAGVAGAVAVAECL